MKKKLLFFSVLSVLLTVFIYSICFAMTLDDLRTQLRIIVKDVNSERWTDTQLTDIINIAQQNVMALTWNVCGSTSIVTAIGQREYALPLNVYAIQRVTLDNKLITEISIPKLDEDNNWEDSTTEATPTQYYTKRYFTPSETNWIMGFDPIPSSTQTAKIYFNQIPTDMSDSTDIPFEGEYKLTPYHSILILYSAYWINLIDNKQAEAGIFYNQYIREIGNMEKYINKSPNYQGTIGGSR